MHKNPKPSDFVKVIAPALRRAAAIARDLEGRVANRPKAGEPTAVKAALTVADTAVQEVLLGPLLDHFPGVCLRAEEDTPTVARFPERADASVVIDPIDGTLRFYLEGGGPYAVMIGLAIENEYEAALVALPRERYVFEAVRGEGVSFGEGDGVAHSLRLESGGRRVLVSHDLREDAVAFLRSRGFEVLPACGGAISVAALIPGVCAGLRVATNDPPDVSIRGRVGAMISAEAGALVRCETGAPFPRDIDAPAKALLVASDPKDLSALQDALAVAGVS
jgi:fructose-1,6-bisphosphatase/inositol monophosphatase family enzyme